MATSRDVIKTWFEPDDFPTSAQFYQWIDSFLHLDHHWVNVKEPPYNAVGDGVADDTAAIQAAITFLESMTVRGVLFLPRSRYLIGSSGLTITNGKGISIVGEGATWDDNNPDQFVGSVLITADTFNQSVLTITTSGNDPAESQRKQGNCLSNFGIVGSTAPAPQRLQNGIRFGRDAVDSGSYGDCLIDQVLITNCKNGIFADYAGGTIQRLHVTNRCTIEKNTYGVRIEGTITNSTFTNSTIRQNGFLQSLPTRYDQPSGANIYLGGQNPNQSGTNNVLIQGCDLEAGQFGVFAYWARALTIRDNYFEACNTAAISLVGSRNVIIEGNEISGPTANRRVYCQGTRDVRMSENVDATLRLAEWNRNVTTDRPDLMEFALEETVANNNNSGYCIYDVDRLQGLPVARSETLETLQGRNPINITLQQSSEPDHLGRTGKVLRCTSTAAFGRMEWQWSPVQFPVRAGDVIVSTIIFKASDYLIMTAREDGVVTYVSQTWDLNDGWFETNRWFAFQWTHRVQSGEANWRFDFALGVQGSGETFDIAEVSTHCRTHPIINPIGETSSPSFNENFTRLGNGQWIGLAAPTEYDWEVGETITYPQPVAGGKAGTKNTTTGWREFGAIDN